MTLVKNGRVYIGGRVVEADVLCEDGVIKKIGRGLKSNDVVDARGKLVLPGVIDPHVHFRVPGGEHKEDWEHASKAAAKGGVTTVLDMPNNTPAITTRKLLDKKRAKIRGKSLVNYGFHFGATSENIREILEVSGIASIKVFMGASTGDLLVSDPGDIYTVFQAARVAGHLVTVHAENDMLINKFAADARRSCDADPFVHTRIRRNIVAAEEASLAAIISKEVGNRLHICHISTRQELDIIRMAGGRITCEATTHHLFLEDKDMWRLRNYGKMNPPLRSHADRIALWENRSLISCWATDHAPHTRAEKERGYWDAPSGVPGVETLLPLHLNAWNKGMQTLDELVAKTSMNAARIFNLEKRGEIKEGFAADLVIVDPKTKWIIKDADMITKCGWTPYDGTEVTGAVTHTIVNGNVVYDGSFGEARGEEVYNH